MKTILLLPLLGLAISCGGPKAEVTAVPEISAKQAAMEIGGKPVVTLSQPHSADASQPQILGVDILSGRGMNIFQIHAYVPGKGEIGLLSSPSLEEAKNLMNGGVGDEYGAQSFKMGGAILVPFANRIRGKVSADGKTIVTPIGGKPVTLDANWKGQKPGAEHHAMHGMILAQPMEVSAADLKSGSQQASVTGTLDAGDFHGHWPSRTNLTVVATLKPGSFGFTVTAKNNGNEDLPVGIGWHPYFALPSGQREQARLKIPARERALVNNYDDVFPTGAIVPVAGSPYDFSGAMGAPLGQLYLDDCFLNLVRGAGGTLIAEIIDPAAHYGVRIKALSPEISAFQAYAPPDKQFVAFEPQFNRADPYSPVWKGADTGMKVLKHGESVTYSVELEVFVP
jgi:galactose mutarotase-like enzyme